MNRRRFLQWLGGTAAGAAASHVLDVDKLLWVPGEKTIFVMPEQRFNTFITPMWMTRESAMRLKRDLRIAQTFDTGWGGMLEIGELINVPVRHYVQTR